MIEKIRKPKESKNLVNYIVYALIFGMIISTFVFMIPGLGGGGGAVNVAAEIGGNTISLRDYTDQLSSMRSRYQKMFKGEIPAFFEAQIKKQVLDSLVRQEVMGLYAKDNDLILSNLEVGDVLKKEIPAFQEDGVFSYSRYNGYLKSVRTTANKFEAKIYKDMITKKLYSSFDASVTKTSFEKKMEESIKSVKVKYQYVELEGDKIQKGIKVSDQDIAAVLSDSTSLKAIENLYKGTMGKYRVNKKVLLSYFLVKEEDEAQKLHAQLTTQNFSEMAKKHSIDVPSKENGGDLGFIARGDYSSEIESKAFGMKAGEISKPFKTKLGFATLYVREVAPEKQKTFAEVKSVVGKVYLQKKGVSAFKKSLQEVLKSGVGGEAKIQEAKLLWSPEKEFLLEDSALPGIGESEEIMSKILALKEEAVYPGILSFKGVDYMVKKKALVVAAKDNVAKNPSQNNTAGRGGALFDLVFQNKKKALNVEENQQLLVQ